MTDNILSQSDYDSYAYINGMKDFEIELIMQAADTEHKKGIELKTTERQATICRAFILRQIYQSKYQRLHIAFDKEGTKKITNHTRGASEVHVHVHFHLKGSYFDTLEQSVTKVPEPIVRRIMANELSLQLFYGLDKGQIVALDTILGHPHKYHPILISGPFGTGKTRVLATAILVLLSHYPAKVLVCTQQRESAENFLSALLTLSKEYVSPNQMAMDKVSISLLIEYGRYKPHLKPYYINAKDLNEKLKKVQSTKILIVSTCITSHKVSASNFTHIMIDEGGLMREPEAVIPLRMASDNTTIVIAGDPQQVRINKPGS
jgi:DNA replication protein DnaC